MWTVPEKGSFKVEFQPEGKKGLPLSAYFRTRITCQSLPAGVKRITSFRESCGKCGSGAMWILVEVEHSTSVNKKGPLEISFTAWDATDMWIELYQFASLCIFNVKSKLLYVSPWNIWKTGLQKVMLIGKIWLAAAYCWMHARIATPVLPLTANGSWGFPWAIF